MSLYFAFGSNLDDVQMTARCPGATRLGRANLHGHGLLFRGPSARRKAGVATIDPLDGQQVPGILWDVAEDHLRALDAVEGHPAWYRRTWCHVEDEDHQGRWALIYRLPGWVHIMGPTDAYYAQVRRAYERLSFDVTILEAGLARST